MTTPWLISYLVLWGVVMAVGFLLLGALRSLGLLQWRFDELQATRPVRKGREGLPPGKRAPDFTLPAATGGDVSLSDFAGRRVLLVFMQSGCGPCQAVVPMLQRLHELGEHRVLVVNKGDPNESAVWAEEVGARFPVVTQQDWSVSKKYQMYATPYAFLIDQRGVIAAKGVASNPQYLRYVLNAVEKRGAKDHTTWGRDSAAGREPTSYPAAKEIFHA